MITIKEVASVNIDKEEIISDFVTVNGDNVTYTLVPKTGSFLSHLWLGTTSIPVNNRMSNQYTIPYAEGGYKNTALESLVDSVGDDIIIANISDNVFDKSIDGRDFSITIPLTGTWSGLTSGLTATTLYGAYMRTSDYEKKSAGPCGVSTFDTYYSETSEMVTEAVSIGQPKQNGVNPDPESNKYFSGIVYLFSDDIQRPNVPSGSTATTTSWSTSSGVSNPYTNGKLPFNFIDTTEYYKDQPVGIVDLYSGIVKIFNNDLVSAFDFSSATGGTGTTEVTYAPGIADVTYKKVDVNQFWRVSVIAGPGEFTDSNNPTWDPETCGDIVYVTKLPLYDRNGNMVAIAVPNEPIAKNSAGWSVFDFKIFI